MTGTPAEHTIVFLPDGRRVRASGAMTLLELAHVNGIGIESICGGRGQCGRCKVHVAGQATPVTPAEEAHLSAEELAAGRRLACQTRPVTDVDVYVSQEATLRRQRIQVQGDEQPFAIDPPVTELEVSVSPPTLADARADLERLADALRETHGIESARAGLGTLAELPALLREHGWAVRVALRGDEIVAIRAPSSSAKDPAVASQRSLGVAVDLGTTKIAVYLVDLETAETIDADGVMNPQMAHGEDVVARISYATSAADNPGELRREASDAIAAAIMRMCERCDVDPSRVLEMVVVGNTCMHHLLLGLPTRQLGLSPFVPASTGPLEPKARELGIGAAAEAYAYMAPPIAGFVGSDCTAVLLASDLSQRRGVVLVVDIGTNTEVALKVPEDRVTGARAAAGATSLEGDPIDGHVTCCSAASGPAFEGARIRFGMRAAPGAIEGVTIDPASLKPTLKVIGDEVPVGICGSGILACVAELLTTGILGRDGKLRDGSGIRLGAEGAREYVLDDSGGIVVTQHDIVEVQLAKAAIRAAIEVALADSGLSSSDIDQMVIAGAFGSYIDVPSAVAIGMLPEIDVARVSQVGNAAGAGARRMLLSKTMRKAAEQIALSARYLELTAYPDFSGHYARALGFPGA